MPTMKYHNAQLPGDGKTFLAEALTANRLAMKQDTSGATYAFTINAADHEHLRTMQQACSP